LDAVQKLKILQKNGSLFSSFVCFYMFSFCFVLDATSSSSSFAVFFALRRAFGPRRYRLLLLLLTRFSLFSVKIYESLWISHQDIKCTMDLSCVFAIQETLANAL
jgi:hypothetical protein